MASSYPDPADGEHGSHDQQDSPPSPSTAQAKRIDELEKKVLELQGIIDNKTKTIGIYQAEHFNSLWGDLEYVSNGSSYVNAAYAQNSLSDDQEYALPLDPQLFDNRSVPDCEIPQTPQYVDALSMNPADSDDSEIDVDDSDIADADTTIIASSPSAVAYAPNPAFSSPSAAPTSAVIDRGIKVGRGRDVPRITEVAIGAEVLRCICPFCGIYENGRSDEVKQHFRGLRKTQCTAIDFDLDEDIYCSDLLYYKAIKKSAKKAQLRDQGVPARILADRDARRAVVKFSGNRDPIRRV